MTQKDKQALLRVRSQARLVRELRERLEDTKAAIGAAALDGMPRGKGGLPRGLEMKVMLRETLEESLKREEKRLRDYEKEAREAMIGMKSGAYAFCLYYYICGMNLEDTARITDRCERQIRRYKRRGKGGGMRKIRGRTDGRRPGNVREMSGRRQQNVPQMSACGAEKGVV